MLVFCFFTHFLILKTTAVYNKGSIGCLSKMKSKVSKEKTSMPLTFFLREKDMESWGYDVFLTERNNRNLKKKGIESLLISVFCLKLSCSFLVARANLGTLSDVCFSWADVNVSKILFGVRFFPLRKSGRGRNPCVRSVSWSSDGFVPNHFSTWSFLNLGSYILTTHESLSLSTRGQGCASKD